MAGGHNHLVGAPGALVGRDQEAVAAPLDRRHGRLGLDRGVTARRAIGYAQAAAQLRGEVDQQEAVETTQALTRRYARRQVSWFRRLPDVDWSETGEAGAVERAVARLLG